MMSSFRRSSLRTLSLAAILPAAAACASFGGTDVPLEPLAMPAAFQFLEAEAGQPVDPLWWTAFDDSALDALELRAMQTNNDLLAGVERVTQARAGLRQAGAAFLPQISAGASTNFARTQRTTSPTTGVTTGGGISESSSARLSAAYEVDLFGFNRASLDGSRAALAAQIYGQRALELAVQADVASLYFILLSLRERLDVAVANLQSVERVMDLVQRQYDEGAVSGFDLSRQRAAVATAQARLPQLEEQLAQAESALAVLLGGFPRDFIAPDGSIGAILPPPVNVGLPSDLLRRRPDLMAAEAGLVGADADIAAARAAFFPVFDLSAGLNIADLTGAATLLESFGASLAGTIFSGGRLEAGRDRAEARYRELAINYRQAVLNAVRDVEDALVSLRTAEQREDLQRIAAEEAQRAFELSEARYQAGADGLLAVLDAQRAQLDASDSLVQARLARLNASVGLFVALGGGWTGDPEALQLTASR